MANTTSIKVSIRLESGGHTFSPESLVTTSGAVEVVVSTHKTTLVPAELFVEAEAASALVAVGCAPAHDERVVCSDAKDGIVAVMAVSAACYDTLMKCYGDRLHFTTPLFESWDMERGIFLYLSAEVLYVRIHDGVLRFAEAMEIASDGDVCYYLESINRVYDIYNMYARALGDTVRLKRILGRLFKNLEIVG